MKLLLQALAIVLTCTAHGAANAPDLARQSPRQEHVDNLHKRGTDTTSAPSDMQ